MKNNKKTTKDTAKKAIQQSSVQAQSKVIMTKKKNNKLSMYIMLGILTFLLTITIAVAVFWTTSKPQIDDENPFQTPTPVSNTGESDENSTLTPQKTTSPDGRKQEMYNLMVVGKDYWSESTDVIMIVSVNVKNNEISVLQIPRDSTVDCGVNENHGKRVNAIYAYSLSALRSIASNPKDEYDDTTMAKLAPAYVAALKDTKTAENREYNDELRNKTALEYLKETLKRTFCIAIDGYVMVDVAGFREIVDVLGGVEVDVPQNMHYDDDEQNLHIHLNKGLQMLNGKDAEGFVRYRYGYVDGDIGRVNAQKIFLSALAKKIISFSTVTKIQPLVETCFEYTTTNLTTTDIVGYVKILLDMNLGNIKFYTAPGEAYQTSSGAWYYSLYMDENIQLINEHFNDYDRVVTPDDVTLRQVVKNYNISYNNQGISAEDIENSELNLAMSDVTYNPLPDTSVTVSTPTVIPSEPENQPADAEEPDETVELDNEPVSESTSDDTSETEPSDSSAENDNGEITENPSGEADDSDEQGETGDDRPLSIEDNPEESENENASDTEESSDAVQNPHDITETKNIDGKKETSETEQNTTESYKLVTDNEGVMDTAQTDEAENADTEQSDEEVTDNSQNKSESVSA